MHIERPSSDCIDRAGLGGLQKQKPVGYRTLHQYAIGKPPKGCAQWLCLIDTLAGKKVRKTSYVFNTCLAMIKHSCMYFLWLAAYTTFCIILFLLLWQKLILANQRGSTILPIALT